MFRFAFMRAIDAVYVLPKSSPLQRPALILCVGSVQVGIGRMVNRIVVWGMLIRHYYEWPIRERRSLFRSYAANSEPLHCRNESRSVQPQPGSSSPWSTNHPIGFTKRRHDVRSLRVGERSGCRGL